MLHVGIKRVSIPKWGHTSLTREASIEGEDREEVDFEEEAHQEDRLEEDGQQEEVRPCRTRLPARRAAVAKRTRAAAS